MGKVIVTMFVSLDGVVEAPEKWSLKHWNDDLAKLKIQANLAKEVSKLKQTYARDILVFGGTTLVSELAGDNLVDEYRLLVYPVVLGSGKRLFKDGTTATLTLAESRTCGPNVVYLRYQPAKQ